MNREAKNMASLMFFKISLHDEASGHLEYDEQAVWGHFVVALCIFLHLNPSHHSL